MGRDPGHQRACGKRQPIPRSAGRLRRCPRLPSLTSVTTSQIHRPDAGAAPRHFAASSASSARARTSSTGFRRPRRRIEREIASMPGVFQLSVDAPLDREVDRSSALGIPAVLLFGLPRRRTRPDRELRRRRDRAAGAAPAPARHPDLLLITDVCFCEYTSHGHCGVLRGRTAWTTTRRCELLAAWRVTHAEAGADIVAPSGMMDGMVRGDPRPRSTRPGFDDRAILSYAAKYASAFYGPFREAAESRRAFGDRREYQMDSGQRARGDARSRAGRGRRARTC